MPCTKSLPIMLALCLMLLPSYYAPNYAGIIGSGLSVRQLPLAHIVAKNVNILCDRDFILHKINTFAKPCLSSINKNCFPSLRVLALSHYYNRTNNSFEVLSKQFYVF